MRNVKVNLEIQVATASFTLNNVIVVDDLALPLHTLPFEISNYCFNETGINVSPYQAIADILIGQDNCDLIVTREIKELNECDCTLSRSVLGCCIQGKLSEKISNECLPRDHLLNHCCEVDSESNNLNQLLQKFVDFDILGITNNPRINAMTNTR